MGNCQYVAVDTKNCLPMNTICNLKLSLISLSFLLGVAAGPALAAHTPEARSVQGDQLGYIEQPLCRIGLALGGVGLIGILISSAIETSRGYSASSDKEVQGKMHPRQSEKHCSQRSSLRLPQHHQSSWCRRHRQRGQPLKPVLPPCANQPAQQIFET